MMLQKLFMGIDMNDTTKTNTQLQASLCLYAAWLISLIATFGALFIGEVLGQTPCVLCWYQRIAMFPLVWILGLACLTNDTHVGRYALPLAGVGLIISLWHSLLYAGIVKEAIVPCAKNGPSCTDSAMLTIANLPIPYLSLISFMAIIILVTTITYFYKQPEHSS